MRALKYIICDRKHDFNMLGGFVEFHRDLIPSKELSTTHIYGGGYFKVDNENKQIILYGDSGDFGKPSKQNLDYAIKHSGNDFLSNLWMIMYMFYRSQGQKINEDDLPDYEQYKIVIE